MLKHVRMRGTILIGAVVAVLVLTLSPQAAADPAATGLRSPSAPTSPDGRTVDPAVLARQIDATVAKAEAPSPKGAASDGADHRSVAVQEGMIGPMSPPGISSLIGTDDRYATNPANWWPASSTVYFTRTVGASINRWCTGWLINANTVITAGHCVHTGGSGGSWYTAAEFTAWPGRYGNSTPYGSCSVSQIHSVVGWTVNNNLEYDYGAMKLNCNVGTTTGTFGFMWQAASLDGTTTYNRGYSQDKGFGEQWASYDQIRASQTRRLFYQHDTVGGNSGGPVYTYSNASCGPCGVAVHAYGTGGAAPGATNNSGTRITEGVFNNFIYWEGL
ncbi:trypsin-like serine peptidase [Phytomonospora endophytica]|uniref:Serine protease n=1 Tax=Phytomonospora endophytica TaxID=714109 RepID=A0A841FSC7_9ACTN|nr:trypsin-like serine protease [Phytomonospora endophytica]MBB6036452.1 glutamyl endopeptidase [Phytomonospora endophytica]GIG65773.1 extracellular metalloprotease [Phytomonospora endophytica]